MSRPDRARRGAARGRLTGRKVLAIVLGGFGVVIAANLALVIAATGSFPGLVVKNSYVASQSYDADRAAQQALGWRAGAAFQGDALAIFIDDAAGDPVRGLTARARVGRPADARGDRTLALTATEDGYAAPHGLPPGLWRVEIFADGPGGERFRAETRLFLSPDG
jgi:nitrogen fixation protein FixH